jgi:hypothetical protein
MLKIRLPEEIMECATMKALWRETVYICLILNDVYSVQKEIVSIRAILNLAYTPAFDHFLTLRSRFKARF